MSRLVARFACQLNCFTFHNPMHMVDSDQSKPSLMWPYNEPKPASRRYFWLSENQLRGTAISLFFLEKSEPRLEKAQDAH